MDLHLSKQHLSCMAKKIAYVINQYPMGSHTFIRREIRALEEQGFEVLRFSVRDMRGESDDPSDHEEEARTTVLLESTLRGALVLARATIRELAGSRRAIRALQLVRKLGARSERGQLVHLAYLAEAARLVELLRGTGTEHVHAHFGTNSATVALLAHALGGPPFSFTAHGPEEFDKPSDISLEEKISRARVVMGVSSYGRSQLLRRTRISDWKKIHVIRCGVDESFLTEEQLTPIPAARRLVCVGRLSEQKGQALLLEAAAMLNRDNIQFELVLVGDGELRAELHRMIRTLQLESNIRITGWATGEKVRAEIRAARALVLPSFAEGLPVVLMEALALGRPVISTWVAGIPELVEDGRNGWLVPAGDPARLAAAMRAALDAPLDQLERLGRAGRMRVLEAHDVREEARALGAIFRDCGAK